MSDAPKKKPLFLTHRHDVVKRFLAGAQGQVTPFDTLDLQRQFNPASQTIYRGGNLINLALEQAKRESDDPRWMTRDQIHQAGMSIRKGAKAAYVEFWDFREPKPKTEAAETTSATPQTPEAVAAAEAAAENATPAQIETATAAVEPSARRRPFARFFPVYNGTDIVGMPAWSEPHRPVAPMPAVKKIATALDIEVQYGRVEYACFERDGSTEKWCITLPDDPASIYIDDETPEADMLSSVVGIIDERAPRGVSRYKTKEEAETAKALRQELAFVYLRDALGVRGEHAPLWNEEDVHALLQADRHELFRAAADAEQIVRTALDAVPVLKAAADARLAANVLGEVRGRKPKTSAQAKAEPRAGGDSESIPVPWADLPKDIREIKTQALRDGRWAQLPEDAPVDLRAIAARLSNRSIPPSPEEEAETGMSIDEDDLILAPSMSAADIETGLADFFDEDAVQFLHRADASPQDSLSP